MLKEGHAAESTECMQVPSTAYFWAALFEVSHLTESLSGRERVAGERGSSGKDRGKRHSGITSAGKGKEDRQNKIQTTATTGFLPQPPKPGKNFQYSGESPPVYPALPIQHFSETFLLFI